MGAKEFFNAIGLGSPFYFGATTYGFFYWLDQNLSEPAKKAISNYLRGRHYAGTDVQSAIVSAFDHLYGHPLLSSRAFWRSTAWTLIVSYSVILFEFYPSGKTHFYC